MLAWPESVLSQEIAWEIGLESILPLCVSDENAESVEFTDPERSEEQ